MDEPWKVTLLKRILPGVICFGAGFTGLTLAGESDTPMIVLGKALGGVVFLILGSIFIAKPVAHLIAAPFIGLLYPEDHSYSPPPIYQLPEMYVRQGRAVDAAREYQKILRHHPHEIRAYLALLEVSFQYMNDVPLAQKTYQAGMKRLKSAEDRTVLEETFQALQAGAPLAISAIAHYP